MGKTKSESAPEYQTKEYLDTLKKLKKASKGVNHSDLLAVEAALQEEFRKNIEARSTDKAPVAESIKTLEAQTAKKRNITKARALNEQYAADRSGVPSYTPKSNVVSTPERTH